MTPDRVDTGTERVNAAATAIWIAAEPEAAEDVSALLRALAAERDDLAILLNAAIEDRDHWKKRYHDMKERAARRLTERDTLRTQLSRAKEAMHTAILKIDNGSPHHARGVLDAALGEMEDEG